MMGGVLPPWGLLPVIPLARQLSICLLAYRVERRLQAWSCSNDGWIGFELLKILDKLGH